MKGRLLYERGLFCLMRAGGCSNEGGGCYEGGLVYEGVVQILTHGLNYSFNYRFADFALFIRHIN